ncbi:MAG: hypothetical protein IJ289_02980 [Clostridia bacterium]|nr:hypothetical protein [Clostridia bacterium]
MDEVMIKLFNMSLTAVWLILAVIVLRLILKKAPKYINLIMWGLVGLRLVCPFTFESVLSLIPSAETIPSDVAFVSSPSVDTGIDAVNEIINPAVSDLAQVPYTIGYSPVDMLLRISFAVWAAGIIVMLVYSFISYLLLKRKVRICVRYDDNIYLCDNIKTPFILGVFKPKIYLPSDINASQIASVIAHEKSHIARLDHIWKPLGFVVMCIHWFNPFVWLSYNLFCRDIEYACDERVIKSMEREEKKDYSETLLSLSMPKKSFAACPLAFGETGVKGRIKSVLSYKKPALWVIIASVIAVIAVAVCFMTNPADESIDGYHYIDKYFYDYVIGEDRANNEMRDISYRIGEDMTVTKFFGTGTGNSEVIGTLQEGYLNDYELELILETLPATYTKNSVEEVYSARFYLSDMYAFIRFSNGDFIGAYLPTDSNGNYYVMDSFRLKRKPDVKIEYLTEYNDDVALSDTTHEKVKIGVVDVELSSSPYIVIKLENNTGDALYYGTMYGVYRHENGQKLDCNIYEDRVWTTPLCMTSEDNLTRKFSLVGYDISEPGRYTVEFGFDVGSYDGDKSEHRAVAEFYVGEAASEYAVVHTSDPSVIPSAPAVNDSEYTTSVIITDYHSGFNAKVLEVNENNILVEPFENEDERNSASRIYVSTELKGNGQLPEIKKGDYVTISYDGQIQETYPAQITNVYSIVLHERGR